MDPTSGNDLLVSQLVAEGVRYIFTKPGASSGFLLDAIQRNGTIKQISCLHESAAVFAAMGYAQASGRPGLVHVSRETGVASGLSALLSAAATRVPLIVIAGQRESKSVNQVFAPFADLSTIAFPFCKWVCQARSTDELPAVFRRAFHESHSPPMGPAMVVVSSDLLEQKSSARPVLPPQLSPIGGADGNFVKRVTQVLISATKPAMIVGSEVAQFHARKEAVALAEVLGCPVFSEHSPSGVNFPNQHRLFAGPLPGEGALADGLFDGCDVILAVGVQNRDVLVSQPNLIPPGAVVAQINMDPLLAERGLPCHYAACADLAESLSHVRAELQLQVDTQWVTRAKERGHRTTEVLDQIRNSLKGSIALPEASASAYVRWFLHLLDELRPRKSVLVVDAGRHCAAPLEVMNLESSSAFIASTGVTPGYGLPASIGVQLCNSDYMVIALCGDGSVLQCPQSLWTAAHHKVPVKVIVLNNGAFGPARKPGAKHGPGAAGGLEVDDPPVSFLELAGSLGVPANSINRLAEAEPALREMLESAGPYLLDVRIG